MKFDEPVCPAIRLDMPSLAMSFEVLADPRIDRTKKHSLIDIVGLVLISICLSGKCTKPKSVIA